MSVTIMRRRVIELGEKAIARAVDVAETRDEIQGDPADSPEVHAFRQVMRLGTSFARGRTRDHATATDCPMEQTVFKLRTEPVNLMAWLLAFAWDDVTEKDGLGPASVVHVNPYENTASEADVIDLLRGYNS